MPLIALGFICANLVDESILGSPAEALYGQVENKERMDLGVIFAAAQRVESWGNPFCLV